MSQELQNFQKWFITFNDGNDEEVMEQYEKTFAKDIVVVGKDANYSYDEWLQTCLKMRKDGVKCFTNVDKVEKKGDELYFYYSAKIHMPDGTILEPKTKAIFKNGKYTRSEPTNPEAYDKMTQN